jgi:hypothetical protein
MDEYELVMTSMVAAIVALVALRRAVSRNRSDDSDA